METRYNKLVRDKIPQIIKLQGGECDTDIAVDEELHERLKDKLSEEVDEFNQCNTLEELADILEVTYALAESLGFSKEDLLLEYNRKNKERGGFKRGVILNTVRYGGVR